MDFCSTPWNLFVQHRIVGSSFWPYKLCGWLTQPPPEARPYDQDLLYNHWFTFRRPATKATLNRFLLVIEHIPPRRLTAVRPWKVAKTRLETGSSSFPTIFQGLCWTSGCIYVYHAIPNAIKWMILNRKDHDFSIGICNQQFQAPGNYSLEVLLSTIKYMVLNGKTTCFLVVIYFINNFRVGYLS